MAPRKENELEDHRIMLGDSLSLMSRNLELTGDGRPSLILGSPPYPNKENRYLYEDGHRKLNWVDWMLEMSTVAASLSKGWCIWVVNGSVQGGCYMAEVEVLMSKMPSTVAMQRPLIWTKNPMPRKSGWFTNAWEYILPFRLATNEGMPFNWESIAQPPKYTRGGKFSNRTNNGKRVNDDADGGDYPEVKLVRPRDVLHVPVGGGMMGSKLAHENEAPFPVKLCLPLIKVLTNPGDIVLDPFGGSGTVMQACIESGRRSVSIDVRESQVALMQKRRQEALEKFCGNV